MNSASFLSTLYRLARRLGIRRDRIMRLLRRMTGLGTKGAMTPKAYGRLMALLDQIAEESREEERLLDRIAAVETLHRQAREGRRLAVLRAAGATQKPRSGLLRWLPDSLRLKSE